MVLAGEIALERLQRAGDNRISLHDREYTNHYDLASSLLEMSRAKLAGLDIHDSAIGRVDLLFQLLRDLGLNKPEDLARYIDALHADFEKRPLAEQVIDQVLSEDLSRYATYEHVRSFDVPSFAMMPIDVPRASQSEAIGQFMSQWIDYERMLRAVAAKKGYKSIGMPSGRFLSTISEISPNLIEAAERLRHFRNQLVHGIEVPDTDYIRSQAADLRKLVVSIHEALLPPQKPRRSSKKASI